MPIPITFPHANTQVTGELRNVLGGGFGSKYNLYVNRFFWGSLHYNKGWVFNSNNHPELASLADYFGEAVRKYEESQP